MRRLDDGPLDPRLGRLRAPAGGTEPLHLREGGPAPKFLRTQAPSQAGKGLGCGSSNSPLWILCSRNSRQRPQNATKYLKTGIFCCCSVWGRNKFTIRISSRVRLVDWAKPSTFLSCGEGGDVRTRRRAQMF